MNVEQKKKKYLKKRVQYLLVLETKIILSHVPVLSTTSARFEFVPRKINLAFGAGHVMREPMYIPRSRKLSLSLSFSLSLSLSLSLSDWQLSLSLFYSPLLPTSDPQLQTTRNSLVETQTQKWKNL